MWILLIIALMKLAREQELDGVQETGQEETVTGYSEQVYRNRPRATVAQDVAEQDSFARCLTELRSRFEGHGMMQSVRRDEKRQRVATATTRAMAPGAYADYGTHTAVSDRFRTGECNGERYMTSRDFARYYAEHRRKVRPDADLRSMTVTRSVTPSAVPAPKEKRPLLGDATPESRRFVGKIASKLPQSVREKHPTLERRAAQVHTWLTSDAIEHAPASAKRRFPTSIASAILIGVISLSLVVGGTVMYSDANAEYRASADALEALKAEEANLERELAVKVDLVAVEDYARNTLGMVDKVYVGGEFVDASKEESVEVYEEEKPAFGLSTLLSAFGFGE